MRELVKKKGELMNCTLPSKICSMTIALTIALVSMLLMANAEQAQASQKSSNELLFEIMDLHAELVTNETFLAQAKMLAVYLEAAQPLEEPKKTKIYAKVLEMLTKIKESGSQVLLAPAGTKSDVEQKSTEEGKPDSKRVYEPGAALLEIFKSDSIENIPALPVTRSYWDRDLACTGNYVLPARVQDVGSGASYVAKFSFYYEAKRPGPYSFTVIRSSADAEYKLVVSGADVVVMKEHERVAASTAQGVCNLQQGFHRVEFLFLSRALESRYGNNAGFQVKILAPGVFDAVPITKDMMLIIQE